MAEDRFQRLQSLFLRAQEIEADKLDAWLIQECGEDQELRDEVMSLLGHDACTVDPLEQGVVLPETLARHGIQQLAEKHEVPSIRYFGDYELLSEIARGGMGVVYQARQTNLDRIVALKMILAGQFASDEAIQRFHIEAAAAANLDHPSIVPVFEVGEQEGHHYYSMGFVEGDSLQDRLRDGPMSTNDALDFCIAIAEAVHYAHETGVIHRDLKPSNILIDRKGLPRVTDFGLAKRTGTDSGLTAEGIFGTPSYMPPEQARNAATANALSDVYSLGGILYASVTGRPPFQAGSHADTIMQLLENEPLAIRELNPSVHRDVETIAHHALQKQPEKRYASAQDFANDLKRFRGGQPIHARPVGVVERSIKWCRRYPAVTTLLASTMVLAIVAVIFASAESVQRRKAEFETTKALNERAAAIGMYEYLARILQTPTPSAALGKELTAMRLLDIASADLDEQFFRPEVEWQIRKTLGNSYQTLANFAAAEKHLTRSLVLARGHAQSLDIAAVLLDLAGCHFETGAYDAAITAAKEAIAIHDEQGYSELRAIEAHRTLGNSYLQTKQMQKARKHLETALAASQSQATDALALERARALSGMGLLETALGNVDKAIDRFESCLAIRKTRLPEFDPLLANTMNSLGGLYAQRDPQEALKLLTESLRIRREILPAGHPDIARTLDNLGVLSFRQGNFESAASYFGESSEIWKSQASPTDVATITALASLAHAKWNLGEYELAVDRIEEVLDITTQVETRQSRGQVQSLLSILKGIDSNGAAAALKERANQIILQIESLE